MARILCLDDEPAVGLILQDTLERVGHEAVPAHNVPQALQALAVGGIDLIISDYRMPGLSGLEFLGLLRQQGYDTPLIMLTGYASIEHAVAAIKAGAVDYITKPVQPEQLELSVNQALEVVRLRRENERLRREVMQFRNERQVIGESAAVRRVLQTVATAAPTRATVLLEGESGTGKELFARTIHVQSERRDGPFIQLNCAALPEGLVESALFGHEKGAFTGAIKRVEGAFERADGGTLLLDEISEMRLDLQAKLLRVLQEQEFERVGGSTPIKVDVRIVATTNRDLAAHAAAGHFRQDLFYRLSVIPIRLRRCAERPKTFRSTPSFSRRNTQRDRKGDHRHRAASARTAARGLRLAGNVRELSTRSGRAVILTASTGDSSPRFDARRFSLTGPLAGSSPSSPD
jgi:DNA-binding NtrC family response regulator